MNRARAWLTAGAVLITAALPVAFMLAPYMGNIFHMLGTLAAFPVAGCLCVWRAERYL